MEQKNIYQRILAVMKDVAYIQKGDKKVNGQYSFVTHDEVSRVLHPKLVEHGIVVIPSVIQWKQDGNRTEADVEVSFVNSDNPDDRVTVRALGFGIDPQDKGPGKAVSYATKYAMLKTFVLETGDDPERDSIDHQGQGARDYIARIKEAVDKDDWVWLCNEDKAGNEQWKQAWGMLGSGDRSAVKKTKAKRDEYRDLINTAALHDDHGAIEQLSGEMTAAQKKAVFEVLSPEAQDVLTKMKQEKQAA